MAARPDRRLRRHRRPEKFFASLAAIKAPVTKTRAFPDHHRFTDAEVDELLALADAEHARLVTTEKDLMRLRGMVGAAARLAERAEAFPVSLEFENPAAVAVMIGEAVARAAARSARRPT
jgi:tetraacyldisaccharide 4'-kinase